MNRREEKIKGDYWYGNKNLTEKRIAYIWFKIDEYTTFGIEFEKNLLKEKNRIYYNGFYDESKARNYSDLLWNKKYPNWNGKTLCDVLEKYENDYEYERPSDYELLKKEIEINCIEQFLKTWLFEEEEESYIERIYEKELNLKSNDFIVKSIKGMIKKYNINRSEIEEGLYVLGTKKERFDNLSDLMRFLSGIYRNISAKNLPLEKKM